MRILSASHANSWVHCAAYEPEQRISETDAAREGSAAAWLADAVLNSEDGITTEDYLGETAPNGHQITPDMCYHVQGYVHYVVAESHGLGFQSEKSFHDPDIGLTGRLDTLFIGSPQHLHIVDFKYGYRIVEPEMNWQFIAYGYLALTKDVQTITFTVYQPRAQHPRGPIRSITYDRVDFDFMCTDLERAAITCQEQPDRATPGEHCNRCAKRSSCPALSANIYAGFEYMTTDVRNRSLTADELSAEIDFVEKLLRLVKDKHTGLQTELETRLESGEFIPDRHRVPVKSNRYFKTDIAKLTALSPEAIKSVCSFDDETIRNLTGCDPEIIRKLSTFSLDDLQELTTCDPFKPAKKSPNELEKEGISPKIMDVLTTTRINGMKTVKHNPKTIERLFKNV